MDDKKTLAQDTPEPTTNTMPVAQPMHPRNLRGMLSHTSSAFTAEYTVYLIALGVVLSNLSWLVITFFGLIVGAMHGGTTGYSFIPENLMTLWLLISSVVALPVAVVFWSRTQGALAGRNELKGELTPGAKGFRTFWLVLSALGVIGLLIVALYVPIAAAISGSNVTDILISVSVPSLIGAAINVKGMYIVTRGSERRAKVRMLMWIVAGATVTLFGVNYLWGSSMKTTPAPRTTYPTSPTSPYDDLYDDPYHTSPSYNY
jgi:hypothetical protein